MQIKSDETEDEETIASSSCLPTTQTYGSDQVAALAALKRALQHAFKLVSRGQNLAKIVIPSTWRSLQILAKLIFQHALVSLQQCHEYIKFRLADEPNRESADKLYFASCMFVVSFVHRVVSCITWVCRLFWEVWQRRQLYLSLCLRAQHLLPSLNSKLKKFSSRFWSEFVWFCCLFYISESNYL